MGFSAPQPAEVNDDRHQEVNQVDALQRTVSVHHPGVAQGGERQKEEAKQGDDEVVVGALQVGGGEVHYDEHEPWEGEDQKYEQAGHGRSPMKLSQKSLGGGVLERTAGYRIRSSMFEATRTVLIVDDDPQILRLLRAMLGPQNVKVLSAPLPSDALRICGQETVDVLISDISMPEMDGNKLAERVLKLNPRVRVLLISGAVDEAPKVKEIGRAHV